MKTRIVIAPGEPESANFVSWQRLMTDVLRAAGELRDFDRVVHIEIGETGINYFVARTI